MYKVSVIVPTTIDRAAMNGRICGIYDSQDYNHKQLILDTSSGSIGDKRNRLCGECNGDIIIHMDSDDIYTPDWISKSVAALIESKADIVGLSSCYFHKTDTNQIFSFDRQENTQLYMPEATLCYWRKTWERNPFPDTSAGEGLAFLANGGRLYAHGYKDGFLATIHGANTCSHNSLPIMKKVAPFENDRLLKHFYTS